jgi:hypothetical protein
VFRAYAIDGVELFESTKKEASEKDEDNFEMDASHIKIRFIKFVEEIHTGDNVEIKEAWIITTDKFTPVETLWKIMRKNGVYLTFLG